MDVLGVEIDAGPDFVDAIRAWCRVRAAQKKAFTDMRKSEALVVKLSKLLSEAVKEESSAREVHQRSRDNAEARAFKEVLREAPGFQDVLLVPTSDPERYVAVMRDAEKITLLTPLQRKPKS